VPQQEQEKTNRKGREGRIAGVARNPKKQQD
jgi:hypothetical protein